MRRPRGLVGTPRTGGVGVLESEEALDTPRDAAHNLTGSTLGAPFGAFFGEGGEPGGFRRRRTACHHERRLDS
jgi:hypothetical protein